MNSSMENLWAPWRMKYIKAVDEKTEGCIFCTKPKENNDKENLILFKGKFNFVILNKFPYNNGHIMVVPYNHISDPDELAEEIIIELWKLINKSKSILKETFRPDGFNIGMNIGRTAGAGIDEHVHMHLVPRWNGDNNFMPVLGKTKVISQGLLDAWEELSPYFTS